MISQIRRSSIRKSAAHFITGKPASLEDETNPDWVPSNMGHFAQNVRKTDKNVERKASDNEDSNQLPLDSKHQKKEEIPSAFQRLCMICLSTKRLIRSTKPLVELYVHLTNIEVEDKDVFSKYKCEDCIQKLKDISKFILMAKNSDEMLKQKLLDNEEMETSVNDEKTLDGEEKNSSECEEILMIEVEKSENELIEKDKDIYKDITCWKCGVFHIGVKFPKIIAYEPPNNIKFQCLKCSEIENRPDKKPPDVMKTEKLPKKEERKIRCSICLKNILLSEYMEHRLNEHRIEKRNRCTVCFLSFSDQRLLKRHSRRHI